MYFLTVTDNAITGDISPWQNKYVYNIYHILVTIIVKINMNIIFIKS